MRLPARVSHKFLCCSLIREVLKPTFPSESKLAELLGRDGRHMALLWTGVSDSGYGAGDLTWL